MPLRQPLIYVILGGRKGAPLRWRMNDGITWFGLGTTVLTTGYDVAYSSQLGIWIVVGTGTNNSIVYSIDNGLNFFPKPFSI